MSTLPYPPSSCAQVLMLRLVSILDVATCGRLVTNVDGIRPSKEHCRFVAAALSRVSLGNEVTLVFV